MRVRSKEIRRLVLRRETLQVLAAGELRAVAGWGPKMPGGTEEIPRSNAWTGRALLAACV